MAFSADNVDLFLSVLDRGSFSAAARALGRVPSAVSMAVAQLEAELDLVLFDRSGREPRPTAAARALEPQARLLAVELLAAPQADALKLLHEGRAQLALVFERPSLDGREGFQEVGSETLVAVMAPGHPMLAHPPAPGEPAQTFRENLLTEVRQIVVAGRDLGQSDPRFVFARHHWRTDNQVVALRLIEAGLGWGWLPQSFVRSQVAAGSLVVLPFENLTNGLALWVDVVWSKERPLGLGARRFIELIEQQRQPG